MHTAAGGVEHGLGVPLQLPPVQVSSTVQALPSSQGAPSTNVYSHLPATHFPIGLWHTVGGALQAPQGLAASAGARASFAAST
jgi:hypothetical protein